LKKAHLDLSLVVSEPRPLYPTLLERKRERERDFGEGTPYLLDLL